ncbi:hypothetical protein [Celeribacter sp.]|uniref:hypothetical protein n=1 Tax=Celeribacter sp. TaxID=1890673 RepID=UPI003A9335F8
MTRNLLLTSALVTSSLVAFSGAASAQGLTYGSVGVSYFDTDIVGMDINAHVLYGDFDYVSGPLSFTGGASMGGIAMGLASIDVSTLSLTAGYAIQPGITVYASLGMIDPEFVSTMETYGLGIEYQTNTFGVALDYSRMDDADVDIYTLAGYYKFGDSTVYGSYSDMEGTSMNSLGYTYDAGVWDVDVATMWTEDFDTGLTAFGGSYDVTDAISVGGGIITLNDEMFDYGVMTIGATYHIDETLSLEANYGKGFGSGFDANSFNVAFTWETGDRRLRVLDEVSNIASDVSPLYDLTEIIGGL